MSGAFRHNHRVTYADCTVGNHIYYSRYLDLLEAARGELFRELGMSFGTLQQEGVIFPVIECRLRYRKPARYDDVLAIELSITALDKVRLNFAARIQNQNGELILEGETFHVCAGLDEKPKRIPEPLAARLRERIGSL